MDKIKAERFHAKKRYRKTQFLHNILVHMLAGLGCSLFFSNPSWFPTLCSSTKHFFLTSLPCIWSSSFNPKCLFVVVNVIVIFLVGESRLGGTNSPSPARDIYNEYIERSRSLREVSLSTPQEKIRQPKGKRVEKMENEAELKVEVKTAEDKEVNSNGENEALVERKFLEHSGDWQERVDSKSPAFSEKLGGKEEINEEDKEIGRKEETPGEIVEEKEREIVEEDVGILPAEELNKRVEEFIARVNRQRWLEAQ
ncbi:hypothetical protein PTKIN_Ptkin14bG0075100 [Pterospermum kingtungense]